MHRLIWHSSLRKAVCMEGRSLLELGDSMPKVFTIHNGPGKWEFLLDKVKALKPSLPVIIVTGYQSVEMAQDAIRNGAADYIPQNAVGGKIGITNSSAANLPITGLRGSYIVCSDSIPGKFAKQLDTTMDNGETNTGSMMATAAGTSAGGAAVAALDDDTNYLVCMGF